MGCPSPGTASPLIARWQPGRLPTPSELLSEAPSQVVLCTGAPHCPSPVKAAEPSEDSAPSDATLQPESVAGLMVPAGARILFAIHSGARKLCAASILAPPPEAGMRKMQRSRAFALLDPDLAPTSFVMFMLGGGLFLASGCLTQWRHSGKGKTPPQLLRPLTPHPRDESATG